MTTELETPHSDLFDPSQLPSELREHLEQMATPLHLMVSSSAGSSQPLTAPRHLRYLNEKIVEAVTDKTKWHFILVEITVRHGKSFFCSWALPTWYLGMYPDDHVILVTYSDNFSKRWGRDCRDLFGSIGPRLFGHSVDPEVRAADNWRVAGHRGTMRSVGRGGEITGTGGNLIIVDDPIKNVEEALSEKIRSNLVEWFDSTLRTRLEPGGTLVVLMARWHEEDLIGVIRDRMAEQGYEGDRYEIIHFPALAEAPEEIEEPAERAEWRDELGRAEGEALWPERFNEQQLAQIRGSTNPLAWSGLYQQKPVLASNNWFTADHWEYVPFVHDEVHDRMRFCRWWDLAASEEASADWTVGALLGIDDWEHWVYVLDIERFRGHPADVEARILSAAERDGYGVPIRMEQERAGSGKTNTANYAKLLIGHDFLGVPAEGTKEQRAFRYAATQRNRRIRIVGEKADRKWKTFVREHTRFPRGRHDDQVDAASGAFNTLLLAGQTEVLSTGLLGMGVGQVDLASVLELDEVPARDPSAPVDQGRRVHHALLGRSFANR